MRRYNYLAESYSFLKADGPEPVANHAVPFDWVTAVEQSLQVRKAKALLRLFALAVRARRGKDHCLTHAGTDLGGIATQQPSEKRRAACRTAVHVAAHSHFALNGC